MLSSKDEETALGILHREVLRNLWCWHIDTEFFDSVVETFQQPFIGALCRKGWIVHNGRMNIGKIIFLYCLLNRSKCSVEARNMNHQTKDVQKHLLKSLTNH